MDIEKLLTDAGVKFEVHKHAETYTAQEMAATEHVTGDAVAKPVVVRAGEEYVLCVLPASCKVDLTKLAKALRAKKCRLAEEVDLGRLFPDVEVGAEAPFGRPYGLETIVDQRLTESPRIAFTAGTHGQTIHMDYTDYSRLAESKVADFSVHL